MKKNKLLVLSVCLVLSLACLFACGKQNSGSQSEPESIIDQTEIALDLFEDKALNLPSELVGEVEWKSSDEEVVTVNGGVLSATGQKEGTATITAKIGNLVYSYPVTVTDSGDRPVLSVDPVSVYKGKTADLKSALSLSYKDEPVNSGITFTYKPVSESVTVSDDGVVTGVTAGLTKIQVKATYKGFTTAAKAVTVTVEESDIVKPASESVTLSIIKGDTDPTSYDIEAEVYVNAEKITDAQIRAEIKSGNEFIELDGLKVTAKAVGKAELLLVYENADVTVNGTLKIVVRDDTADYKAGTLLHTNGNSTFKRVFDGEFNNCYEYQLGTEGNYWDNAVIESTSLESIVNSGYKTFSYDIYFADVTSFVAYIPSAFQSSSGAYALYDLSTTDNKFSSKAMGKYTGDDDLLHMYENGVRLADETELQTGKWYTVVYDLSTYSDGWSMMGFALNESSPNGQKAYLRNFAFHTTANLLPNGTYDERHPIGEFDDPEVTDERDDFLNNLTISSKAVSVKKVTSGTYANAYKIRSQITSSSGMITFNDIHDANSNEPKKFFTEGYHYVKFDLYIVSGNGLGICNWVKGVNGAPDVKLETTISKDNTSHDTVTIYNARGNESSLDKGAWYTIVVNIPYDDDNLPDWDLFYIGLSGSKYVPAVGYVKNFEYLKDAPVIEGDNSEIAKKISTSATLTKQTEAVDGVENAYLYENTEANWYVGNLAFKVEEYIGKVVSLKVRFTGEARPYYSINYVNSFDRRNWTFDDKIHYFDLEGNYVMLSALKANVWYNLVIDLAGSTDWINYITLDAGESMYIADLQILDENPFDMPEVDDSEIGKNIKTDASLVKQTEAVDGVENAYLYKNTCANYYVGCLTFGQANAAVTGKVVTLKVRLCQETSIFFAVNYTNSYDKTNWTSDDKIKYYDADKNAVTSLSKDVWYTVVIDLSGTTDWLWYLTLEKDCSMYIADLQILESNPYTQA